MMHAEVGFQAVRLSLRDDVTLFLLTVRHDGTVPTDDRAAQQALLRRRLAEHGLGDTGDPGPDAAGRARSTSTR